LEGCWTIVSIIALIGVMRKKI